VVGYFSNQEGFLQNIKILKCTLKVNEIPFIMKLYQALEKKTIFLQVTYYQGVKRN